MSTYLTNFVNEMLLMECILKLFLKTGLNGKEEGLGLNGMVLRLKLVWGLYAVTDLTVWDSGMVYLERDTENVFSARYRSLNQRTYQGMSKTDCEV